MIELLTKNNTWVWSKEFQGVSEGLKEALTEELVLNLPDFSKTFDIHTDVSEVSIREFLMQDRHTIAFESLKLNEA